MMTITKHEAEKEERKYLFSPRDMGRVRWSAGVHVEDKNKAQV